FVPATVDGIEEALPKVGSCAEELHLLSHQHRGHATSDCTVISPGATHDFVAFELDGTRVDCHLGGETTEGIGHPRGIPDRQIRLRSGAEIVKRVKKTKTCFRYQRPSVIPHSANRFRDPSGITREELVIFWRA